MLRAPANHPAANLSAIVLAGTYQPADGTFSGLLPRPLLPIAQVPVVEYVLRWLRDAPMTRATICANGGSRAISACLHTSARLPMDLDFVHDEMPRGPAGSARDAALATTADTFIVVDATVIPDLDVAALATAHATSGAAVTVVVHYAATGRKTGHRVATPAGIYVFSRRAFEAVSPSGFQDIKEHLLPALRRRHERVVAYPAPRMCPRVLNAETYLAVNHWMIERMPANLGMFEHWGAFTTAGNLVAHSNADIHPTAKIVGPAILGAGVMVGAHATIVGPTSIGPDTRIGNGALVCRSVLWNGCSVGERAFVDQSVVASGVALRAGAIVEREVRVDRPKSQRFHLGLLPQATRLQPAPAGSLVDLAVP